MDFILWFALGFAVRGLVDALWSAGKAIYKNAKAAEETEQKTDNKSE